MTTLTGQYCSNGFRSIARSSVEDMREAATMFANRQARREFGRKGYCRILNQDSISVDRKTVEWQAFIGYTSGLNETTGHNIHFTVTVDAKTK